MTNAKSENVFVVANNVCKFSIDVPDDHMIMVKSISGILRTPVVLKDEDYVDYINIDDKVVREQPAQDVYSQMTEESILSMFSNLVAYDDKKNQYYYPHAIQDCSTRMKYVLGIAKLPIDKGEQVHSCLYGNGPSFFMVTCDNLYGSGTIMPNVYMLNSPFQLPGPGFSGNNLTDLCFRIRGLYGEEVKIEDDLLWEFELIQSSQDYKKFFRLNMQYK